MNFSLHIPAQTAVSGGNNLNDYLLQGLAQLGCRRAAKSSTALVDGILWEQVKTPLAPKQIGICHGPIDGREKAFYQSCHGVIFVSQALAQKARQLFGPLEHTFVLNAGSVSCSPYKHKISRDRNLRLAQVGRWDENKGQLDLVKHLARWHQARPTISWHLTLVGNQNYDAHYSKKVMSIVEVLPQERVTILGEVSSFELTHIYQQADVVIVSSRYESLSLVTLEAANHGTLVLGWGRGGIRHLLGQGAGLLLSGPQELPRVLTDLYYQKRYLDRLHRRAHRFATRLPNWNEEANRLLCWLKEPS